METTTAVQNTTETPPQKKLVVGVQFRLAGKIYTFTTSEECLVHGKAVIVETEGGSALGYVIVPPHEMSGNNLPQNLKKVLHVATDEEIKENKIRREKSLEYFDICEEKIRSNNLQMKLVDVQLEENGKKIVFIFYAEDRIDFRNLVKELAQALHTRIEMRQIGARDDAKNVGALGPCGLETCCSKHLRQFESISISMAKHQGLAPNPAKLTGMCGKLKCCLSYEHEVYNEYRKDLPKIGLSVSTPHGSGKISGHNILKRECTVKFFGGGECRCPCEQCKPLTNEEREAALEVARKAEEANEERGRKKAQRRAESNHKVKNSNRGKR